MLVRSGKAGGFSLIELLLVVAVLAIAAGFGIPALQGTMTAYRLKASADIVAGELDAARVMAISRGAEYQVRFTEHAVAVVDPLDAYHPPRVPKTMDPGVRVASSPTTLTYRPRGTCVWTPAAASAIIQLQDTGNKTASITVTGTGRMTVSMSSSTPDN